MGTWRRVRYSSSVCGSVISLRRLRSVTAGLPALFLFLSACQVTVTSSDRPHASDLGELKSARPRWGLIHRSAYPFNTAPGSPFATLLTGLGVEPAVRAPHLVVGSSGWRVTHERPGNRRGRVEPGMEAGLICQADEQGVLTLCWHAAREAEEDYMAELPVVASDPPSPSDEGLVRAATPHPSAEWYPSGPWSAGETVRDLSALEMSEERRSEALSNCDGSQGIRGRLPGRPKALPFDRGVLIGF